MAEKEKKAVETGNKHEKTAKAKNEKKPGKIRTAWKGFKSELKKIVWPTWKQVLRNTGIVAVIVVVCTLAIAGLDIAFREGFDALVGLFS